MSIHRNRNRPAAGPKTDSAATTSKVASVGCVVCRDQPATAECPPPVPGGEMDALRRKSAAGRAGPGVP